jgi:WD40 repeat protein
MGDSEEIRRFREAVRARIERVAADAGRDVRAIPPAVLLSLLSASAFTASITAPAGMAQLDALSSRAVLGGLISTAIDAVQASSRTPSPQDLEREIYRQIERVLAAQDQRAAALRGEIAAVLAETDALRSALFSAIETGNERLRNDVIAAIDTLSGGFPEMAFLLRTGDQDAAQLQRRLDGQGAEFRALSETIRRQSADVRMARQDLATIRNRQHLAGRTTPDADRGAAAGNVTNGRGWQSGCPYRGLLPFDQERAEVYCGRQRLTAELVVKLAGRLAGPAMVVVSGASGAGKSSLLHAGLLPALAAGIQLEGSGTWPRVVMTPTGDPLTELATRLAGLGGGDAAAIRRGLGGDPDRAHLVIGRAVPARPVLVVDQFEEVFTLAPARGDGGQRAFIAALCAAASQPFGPRGEPAAVVVIAVRGDFWARCAAHAGLASMMQDGTFVVGPMTGAELREAITGPAAIAGLQVDGDLADTILADLRTAGQDETAGALPLLSQAMMLTWLRREGNRLTVQGYQQTGGVARSVEFGAEAVFEALPDAGQQAAKEIFRALVLVSPDGQLARRTVPRAELAGRRDAARHMIDTVLEAFASSRLLVLDGDPGQGGTVQIAHDVLLRAWPRLRGWLDSDQANWILYTQLQEDAAEWARHGRDSSFLYRGSQLAAVQQAAARWAADPARYPALTGDQSGFLDASRQHAARSARTRRVAAAALALLLVGSVAGAGIATQADRTANQQRNAAVSNQLAAESDGLDATNPVTAASLAAAAWKIDPTAQAQTSMLDVLAQPERGAITAAAGNVTGLTFSPDGKRFVTTTDSGKAQIWDTATRHEIGEPVSLPHVAQQYPISFGEDGDPIAFIGGLTGPEFWDISTRKPSGPRYRIANNHLGPGIVTPDGKILATTSGSGKLLFLNVATHREIGAKALNGTPAAFSPDGKLLAVWIGNNTFGLMNVATQQLYGPTITVSVGDLYPDVAFSPDDKIVAVSGWESVSFWSVATGHMIGKPLHVAASGIAISPDGKVIATFAPNGTRSTTATVNLWDVASHAELGGPLTVDATDLLGFTADSTTVITADGSTVNFWDVAVGRQVGPLMGGTYAPITFSPDGQTLAAATLHGAGLWSLQTRREIGGPVRTGPPSPITRGPPDGAVDVAFSPDGKTFATAGQDPGAAELWDVATRREIDRLAPDGIGSANAVAFSPDGKDLLIAGGTTPYAWVWDIQTGRVVGRPLYTGDEVANTVAFSPDGSLIAIASDQIKLYSTTTHRLFGVRFAYDSATGPMAFSPDGSMIAVATVAGVTLWDVATQRQIGTAINAGQVNSVAFSPDGQILAVADEDGAIRLWDVASRELIGSALTANTTAITGIAFSPDGRLLAAVSADYATRVWGVDLTSDTVARVCALAGGSMTRQQWSTYVKSEPYQATCP